MLMRLWKRSKTTLDLDTNMKHSEIISMSTKKLKFILKNDDPDVETHDMIDKELYYREQRSILLDD